MPFADMRGGAAELFERGGQSRFLQQQRYLPVGQLEAAILQRAFAEDIIGEMQPRRIFTG